MQNDKIKYWKSLVDQQNSSGKKVKPWCNENNISPSSFYKWKRIINNDVVKKETTPFFLPVTVEHHNDNLTDDVCIRINGVELKCNKYLLVEIIGGLI